MTSAADATQTFDPIIRNGGIHDGSGAAPYIADVGVAGDVVAAIGALPDARAANDIDAAGLALD